jgi:hypothetical protein
MTHNVKKEELYCANLNLDKQPKKQRFMYVEEWLPEPFSAVVLFVLCSEEPQVSAGDSQNSLQHVTFVVNLVNNCP